MASISKKPNGKVSSLTTPKRENNTQAFTSTFKVPSGHTSDSNNARATGVEIDWQIHCADGKPWIRQTRGVDKTSSTLQLNQGWKFSNGKKYDRQKFWPYADNRIYSITCWVRETNSKGRGEWVSLTRKIEYPYDPKIAWPVMVEEGGRAGNIDTTVTWDKDNDGYHDADRCQYWIMVTDTTAGGKRVQYDYGTRASETFTLTYDAVNRMKLAWDDYILVEFQAKAQGWRGNSYLVTRKYYVSYPRIPTIKEVHVSSRSATGKVTALIDLNNKNPHPVTGCNLEYLTGTEAQTAEEATASDSWRASNSTDDGQCSALAVTAETLLAGTTPGKTVWVRIKSWNNNEDIFYRYSEPVRITDLETPSAGTTTDVSLLSVEPAPDGSSAIAHVAWNDDIVTTEAETEISWSTDAEAWNSTDEPKKFLFDWEELDSQGQPVPVGTYAHSAYIHIKGLDEGETYYVRARRSYGESFSAYAAETLTVMPVTAPSSVSLLAPQFIARGDSLSLTWTSDSTSEQKRWQLFEGTVTSTVDDTVTPPVVTETFAENKIVAEGTDAIGGAVISAERLEGLVGDDDSISLAVRVSTGGEFVQSNAMTVQVVDAPVLEMTNNTTMTAQGESLTLRCSAPADVALVIVSQGSQGEYPDGVKTQVEGDTVLSLGVRPEWTGSGDTELPYQATVTLPDGLDLWDGATYTIYATATDNETNLTSGVLASEFTVEWSHQAPKPANGITLTPSDATDAEGFRVRKVEIQLSAPQSAAAGDRYEVYRVTPDGVYLIADDQEQDALVTDLYAPFGSGDHVYRIAVRTADGDVDFDDYPYELDGGGLRVDFGSQYIELPWNVVLNDSFTKDFEARDHLGADKPEGYWNETVRRKASLSTDLIKVREASQAAMLRDLAQYDGPCFVRARNGVAFQANINVTGLDDVYNGEKIAVALDAEEVQLTSRYMAFVEVPEIPEEG